MAFHPRPGALEPAMPPGRRQPGLADVVAMVCFAVGVAGVVMALVLVFGGAVGAMNAFNDGWRGSGGARDQAALLVGGVIGLGSIPGFTLALILDASRRSTARKGYTVDLRAR